MKLDLHEICKSDTSHLQDTAQVAHVPIHGQSALNWDARIVTPPPRPMGTVRAKLRYAGRSKPIPLTVPQEK